MCIRQQVAPELATRPASSGSKRNADTSFTMRAPAWSAASATTSLVVSMETRATPPTARRSTTGTTRWSSSSAGTGSAPGRVDSPPTSSISAPSAASSSPCLTAASASRNSPPSENESGVTLTTPITVGHAPSMGASLRDDERAERSLAGAQDLVRAAERARARGAAIEDVVVPVHSRLLAGLELDLPHGDELVARGRLHDRLGSGPLAVLRRVERVPRVSQAAKVVGEALIGDVEVQEAHLAGSVIAEGVHHTRRNQREAAGRELAPPVGHEQGEASLLHVEEVAVLLVDV